VTWCGGWCHLDAAAQLLDIAELNGVQLLPDRTKEKEQ
jgi:hypothetical protein